MSGKPILGNLESEPSLDPRNKYALVIGINQYEHNKALKYCVEDAKGIYNSLVGTCGFLPENVRLIPEEQATREHILDVLEGFGHQLKGSKGELVLFYYAGHGMTIDNSSYLVPTNDAAKPRLAKQYSLKVTEIFEFLYHSFYRQIVLIDSCRTSKPGMRSPSSSGIDYPEVIKREAAAARGLMVLFGSRHGESSWESEELGHGVFSYFLIKGLSGEAIDRQGRITFGSLNRYTHGQMAGHINPENSNTQYPEVAGAGSNEIVIAVLEPVTDKADQTINELLPIAHNFRLDLKWSEAATVYRAARLLGNDDPGTLLHLGYCEDKLHRYDEAMSCYGSVIQSEQSAPRMKAITLNIQAALLIRMGKQKKALKNYDDAFKLGRGNGQQQAITLNNRAALLIRMGELDKAEKDYHAALKYDPLNPVTLHSRADLLVKMGKLDKFLEDFDAELEDGQGELQTFFICLNLKAKQLINDERYRDAIEKLDTLIQKHHAPAVACCMKGECLMKLGKYQEAVDAFASALDIDPEINKALKAMGHAHRRLGNYLEARSCWQKCLERCEPGSSKHRKISGLIEDLPQDNGN